MPVCGRRLNMICSRIYFRTRILFCPTYLSNGETKDPGAAPVEELLLTFH